MNEKHNLDTLTRHDYQRYAKHLILPEIQLIGQRRLQTAKILFIGAGGLASTTLLYLVSSGLNNIGIVDDDIIELSNLHRQIIYNETNIGSYKVDVAKKQLMKMNSTSNITIYKCKLDSNNAEDLIKLYDIVVDSTDNFQARYILSKVCKQLHKAHIYGAIGSFAGQISVFNYQGGLSYNEMYLPNKKQSTQGCSEEGVIPVLPGLIGIMQATEIIKIITGTGEVLHEKMLAYNALQTSFKVLRLHPIKQQSEHIEIYDRRLETEKKQDIEIIEICQLYDYLNNNDLSICLIDIRSNYEYQLSHLQNSLSIPLSSICEENIISLISVIAIQKHVIIYCNSIVRTHVASNLLRKQNIMHSILNMA